jgi:formylglycine-generating enzyme required for sulfatase activity
MRLTDGKQRPYQNGSIVSDLYYTLGGQQPGGGTSAPATAIVSNSSARGTEVASVPSPVMVPIPAGTFTMGSPELELDRAPFGETAHEVRLSGFYLAAKELSVGEFRRFVEDTGHITTAEADGGAFAYNETKGEWEFRAGINWQNPGFRQGDDHPVVAVSWFDAVNYCNWLSTREGLRPVYTVSGVNVSWDKTANGYRLPTDAEWEYACRARTTTPFFTGTRISTAQANYNGNFPYNYGNRGLFRNATMPAGSFPPNGWGIYDMHGNVWEWCWDYHSYLRGVSAVTIDPSGPDTGQSRINRGGSWASPGKNLRSAARSSDLPESAFGSMGFRLARNSE